MTQRIGARYGGFSCSAEFALTLGISPGSGTIVFDNDNVAIPKIATLEFFDGLNKIKIFEVYADKPRFENNAETGQRNVATIYDRRFKWQWGKIVGIWNTIDNDGKPKQERRLKLLLEDCLAALNETSFRFYDIPIAYPEVIWEFENPAVAMQKLCEKYGLVIGIELRHNNPIFISSWNKDRSLPNLPRSEQMGGKSGDILPKKVTVVGNRLVMQRKFRSLIPVGMEINGTIKPIDSLSYAPTDWGIELTNLFRNISDVEERKLAEKCIFKWYSIDWTIHDYSKVLPLLNIIAELTVKDGTEVHEKPYVLGPVGEWDGIAFSTNPSGRLSEGFTIKKDLGIVEFNDVMVEPRTTGDFSSGGFNRMALDLVAAYERKENDDTDFVWFRKSIPNGEIDLEAIHRESSIISYNVYDDDTGEWYEQNTAVISEFAEGILDKLVDTYSISYPNIYTYVGILPVGAWGIVNSVTWSADSSGATTEVQVNVEVPKPLLPSYKERLERKKLQTLWHASEKLDKVRDLYPFD